MSTLQGRPAPRPSPTGLGVAPALVLVGVSGFGYYLAARVGYHLTLVPSSVTLWPGAGLLLGLLLLRPRHEWWLIIPAALAGNVLADLGHHLPIATALAGGGANIIESLVGALTVEALVRRPVGFGTLREALAILLGAAVVSNAVTGVLGSLVLGGYRQAFGWDWFIWWAGDGLGMMVFAPLVLAWGRPIAWRRFATRSALEAGLVLLGAGLVAATVVGPESGVPELIESARYLVIPLLLLAGLRYGVRAATAAVAVVGGVVVWRASHVTGVFLEPGQVASWQVVEVYEYIGLVAIVGLIPAVVFQERESARRGLRESEARFREMAEHIEDVFFVLDLDSGVPLYVSPTWSRIWGLPIARGLDPAAWFEAIHPDDRGMVAASQDAVREGQSSEVTFRVTQPSGALRWVFGRAFPVLDAAGRSRRLVGVARDITELRAAQERKVRSERMESLGRLAGGVAHDFNNVLTVILADTGFLLEDLREAPARELVLEVRKAAERAAGMTRQLLAFSRRQPAEPTVFDLNDLVEEMHGMLRRLLRENVELRFVPSATAPLVLADRGQIGQVLINLAANAKDAMPQGGRLTLEIEVTEIDATFASGRDDLQVGPHVVLTASDTGVGMSDEVRKRVFEPFFTTKGTGQGTGLGLATSHGIVQKAGGQMSVYSEPGLGTTFLIHLPLAVGEEDAASSPVRTALPGGAERILLVEDEDAVRRIARRILETLGYRVTEAPNAAVALELLGEDGDFDLLFTDVVMPVMSGRELFDRVRALRPEIRVLFMSGYTEDVILQQMMITEGTTLLRKPFTREKLARAVRHVLDGGRHPLVRGGSA